LFVDIWNNSSANESQKKLGGMDGVNQTVSRLPLSIAALSLLATAALLLLMTTLFFLCLEVLFPREPGTKKMLVFRAKRERQMNISMRRTW
jgi:hypothetical protein